MTLWYISVAFAIVVTVVVGVLLTAILRQARKIEAGTSDIWDAGQRIASNTIHVPALAQSNVLVANVLECVPSVLDNLNRIREHAENCPGCPNCIIGGE